MRKSRFTENEMVRAVKQFENGMSSDAICRELGISRMTLYKWKSKYSGMEASRVRRLKELEEENRKLKQMYANIALDNQILKEIIKKKPLKFEDRKKEAEELVYEYDISISRACRIMDIYRSYFYYRSKKDDGPIDAIKTVAMRSDEEKQLSSGMGLTKSIKG